MNYAAWYWDPARPDVASYWDGHQWLQTLPLIQLQGVRILSVTTGQPLPPRQLPSQAPAPEPFRQVPTSEVTWFGPKKPRKPLGTLMRVMIGVWVAVALAVVALGISAVVPAGSVSAPVAEKTKANGFQTCKELIKQQPHSSGTEIVQADVLVGDLYKTNIVYQGYSDAHRWTCRLEWTGSRWRTDILESKKLFG